MNDPVNTIIAPWAQFGVLGLVVSLLLLVTWHLWQKLNTSQESHLAEVRAYGAKAEVIAEKKIESELKMAHALEGLETVVKTALDTMQRMK